MFNKSLLITGFFFLSLGVSSHAATMSSDTVDGGIFEPSTTFSINDDSQPRQVETQASAYFAPPTDETKLGAGEDKSDDTKSAVLWGASALALGSFFSSSSSDTSAVEIPSSILVPGQGVGSGPEVAPVPELNSGVLVLLALGGMGLVTIGRRRFFNGDAAYCLSL